MARGRMSNGFECTPSRGRSTRCSKVTVDAGKLIAFFITGAVAMFVIRLLSVAIFFSIIFFPLIIFFYLQLHLDIFLCIIIHL